MEGLQDIWGWQPALYLFLGGMGAGAFIAAMVVYFKEGERRRRTVCASVVASVVCLAVGLLLLLSELITPLRGMMMWQSFSNFSSWMTFGAWIVFAALLVFACEAVCVSDGAIAFLSRLFGPGAQAGESARRRRLRVGIVRGGLHWHSAHVGAGGAAVEHDAHSLSVHRVRP